MAPACVDAKKAPQRTPKSSPRRPQVHPKVQRGLRRPRKEPPLAHKSSHRAPKKTPKGAGSCPSAFSSCPWPSIYFIFVSVAVPPRTPRTAKNCQEPPRTAETQILRQQALKDKVVGGRRCPPEGGLRSAAHPAFGVAQGVLDCAGRARLYVHSSL